MAIFEPHRKPTYVRTDKVEVFDVTGAGDTVIGTLALGLGTGLDVSIKEAAELANYAAGVVVGRMGTAAATQEDLMEAIKKTA